MSKVTILGGGGVRTPLLIYGLAHDFPVDELCLFDTDTERAETIARLGREIAQFPIRVESRLDHAVAGASFVLNSVRVGGMAARARDERITLEHGLPGQETTGPGGAAMALRTLPVTLAHARIVERFAPEAWFINFTNPAGLMTQALTQNTGLRVIGICDTPSELFYRITETAGGPLAFDYAGLNHLGWVRRVRRNGDDITASLLADVELLRRIYPADLFDPELIQTLRLIPTEYLFFYYSGQKAYQNQIRAGATRGEELQRLNVNLFEGLTLEKYRNYLLQRNASYLKLEAEAEYAFDAQSEIYDHFKTATGYLLIALEVMRALASDESHEIVLNVPNRGAIEDLQPEDVVEVPCAVSREGAKPSRTGPLPEGVRGLVIAVKEYERELIRASLTHSKKRAQLALTTYPIIGQWEIAGQVLDALIAADPDYLSYLR
jgi:6-phospho-beta-glucosidase